MVSNSGPKSLPKKKKIVTLFYESSTTLMENLESEQLEWKETKKEKIFYLNLALKFILLVINLLYISHYLFL